MYVYHDKICNTIGLVLLEHPDYATTRRDVLVLECRQYRVSFGSNGTNETRYTIYEHTTRYLRSFLLILYDLPLMCGPIPFGLTPPLLLFRLDKPAHINASLTR